MRGQKIPYELNHRIVNEVLEKKCNTCENWFPCTDEFFYKSKGNITDGLRPDCKKWTSKRSNAYQYENYERALASHRRWNKTEGCIKAAERNFKKQKGNAKAWRRRNKDELNKRTRERALHKTHEISNEELKELYEYANYSCMYCGISEKEAKIKYRERLHKDHAYNNGSNGIGNCILACKSCNSSKHNRDWDRWYPNNKRFKQDLYDKIAEWLNRFPENLNIERDKEEDDMYTQEKRIKKYLKQVKEITKKASKKRLNQDELLEQLASLQEYLEKDLKEVTI